MKNFLYLGLLLGSFFLGRMGHEPIGSSSVEDASVRRTQKGFNLSSEPEEASPSLLAQEKKCSPQVIEKQCQALQKKRDKRFTRTETNKNDKKMTSLFWKLMEAMRDEDVNAQNDLFSEMEELNPLHEKVYQVKSRFLQDDDDWQGAHDILKECVEVNPDSLFCHRRLSNIRSSTVDEKIVHSKKCLELSENDPLCLVDLAMAYRSNNQFKKAQEIFERALELPRKQIGFRHRYVLFQYGMTLEELSLYQEANEAYTDACELNMKSACQKLDKGRSRKS